MNSMTQNQSRSQTMKADSSVRHVIRIVLAVLVYLVIAITVLTQMQARNLAKLIRFEDSHEYAMNMATHLVNGRQTQFEDRL